MSLLRGSVFQQFLLSLSLQYMCQSWVENIHYSVLVKIVFNINRLVMPIKAAGAGYKALQVVEGRADLYLHTTAIKKWDICAGDAILKATGGQMTTREGKEIDYSFQGSPLNEHGIVATASTANHDKYLTKLRI